MGSFRSGRIRVALRKESVDRNAKIMNALSGLKRSLSARRAWIEICRLGRSALSLARRSPQGERG